MIAPLWIITAGALALLHTAGAPHVTPTWEPGKDTLVVGSVPAAKAAAGGWKAILADHEKWRCSPPLAPARPRAGSRGGLRHSSPPRPKVTSSPPPLPLTAPCGPY